MKSLPTTLRIALPLVVSVAIVCLLFARYQARAEWLSLRRDLSRRSEVIAVGLQTSIETYLERTNEGNTEKYLQRLVERIGRRDQLKGIAVYDISGRALAMTSGLALLLRNSPVTVARATRLDTVAEDYVTTGIIPLHLYALPLHRAGSVVGSLAIVHDVAYMDTQVSRTLRDSLIHAALQTLLIGVLAVLLVRWNFIGPLGGMAKWLNKLRTGQAHAPPVLPQSELFLKLSKEVTHLANDLSSARSVAEQEARLRNSDASLWTAERLRVSLRDKLGESPFLVASNREPYIHAFNDKGCIQVSVPASGLVTALEPVLFACDGTWVAHGSGSADREVVDRHDHLHVPPDHPSYVLRRVWLTPEEERGYYLGFANEGLWPLCHIAHTRPIFRPQDWEHYQEVNRRFADAILEEMQGTESPILFAQDYHFALLPRLVKEARPDARVAIFWHIPWPNSEIFGICPWQRELVEGLLGADLIGFHIQLHCNNFLDTVYHALEALTEWDRFAVNRQGHTTCVRPYPISVAFGDNGRSRRPLDEERAALFAEFNIEASLLGIGVDRVDYTKGIIERFWGVERFLELFPVYQNRFTFVQIGAPSRTDIDRYEQFLTEVSSEADRINARFQNSRWKPIVLLKRHHSHEEIERFYRAASVCLVTSLHDGMNLVAKEFVAARDDGHGALILSTFTGAANELPDALLINPYNTQQLALAIQRALEMSDDEQCFRMQRMRRSVREHNIYRWAATLLSDLAEIPIETPERVGGELLKLGGNRCLVQASTMLLPSITTKICS